MPLFAGQLINDRYRIDALRNQDDSGALYRAWDMNLNMQVTVLEHLGASAESQQQFSYEVEQLTQLSHTNLPQVLDRFTLPGQNQYLVLEFIEGEDLQTMLNRQGALPPPDVLDWIAQVSEGLAYLRAQAESEFYPDFEPAQIIIRPDGRAVLMGFDLLKRYDPSPSADVETGEISAAYNAPELYGQGQADVRSDIYTLGIILYYLLTGQMPPESVQLVTGGAKLTPPRRLNPDITPGVEQTILQAMAPDATRRFQSLEALQRRLLNLASAPDDAAVSTAQRPAALWLVWVSGLSTIVMGLIAVAAIYFAFSRQPESPVVITVIATFNEVDASREADVSREADAEQTPAVTTEPIEETTALTEATPAPADEVIPENTPAPVDTPLPTPTTPPTEDPTPAIASTITDPLTDVSMLLVPAGPFIMGGSSASEDGQLAHTVILNDFYIDQYEVTNARYAACVANGACQPPANPASYTRNSYYGNPEYDNYPVIQISWDQAVGYCAWRGARLPTEAEWEKAARGSNELIYPGGSKLECSQANYWSIVSGACVGDTVAVGSYPEFTSPYGPLDMAGNVWEWVADWYAEDYYANSMAESPQGPDTGTFKVLRGGSWVSNELNARSTFRNSLDPTSISSNIGFRCVVQP